MVYDSWDDVMGHETDNWKRCTSSMENLVETCNTYAMKVHDQWHEKSPWMKMPEYILA